MKPIPQEKIPHEVSVAFTRALDFMRMPSNEAAILFTGIDAAEAGEKTKSVIADVARAYAYQLMSFENAARCAYQLGQLWVGPTKKSIKMSDECKMEILGVIHTITQDQPENIRLKIIGLANVVFAAAGNPTKGRKGVLADEARSILNSRAIRSSLGHKRAEIGLSPII